MDIVIYGTGTAAKELYINISKYYKNVNVVAFTKSKLTKEDGREFLNIKLCDNKQLTMHFDYLVIATWNLEYLSEIKACCINELSIDSKKLKWHIDFLRVVRKEVVMNSIANSEDAELVEIYNWLGNHELTTRNPFCQPIKKYYEVFVDEMNGYPYVNYFGHKMYYPKDYEFNTENDKQYLVNIWEDDQFEGSPHLYEQDNHKVCRGDVIVDAGTAEGNFALKYIDIVKKAYLIEPDPRWREVLNLTFAPYKEKIEIVPYYLSYRDNEEEITLDTIVKEESIDFLKMDIEGSEPLALLGGIHTFKKNNVKISACAYHKARDAEYISFLLRSIGYKVGHSDGYMFFNLDRDIDRTLDFRRGVIYGDR